MTGVCATGVCVVGTQTALVDAVRSALAARGLPIADEEEGAVLVALGGVRRGSGHPVVQVVPDGAAAPPGVRAVRSDEGLDALAAACADALAGRPVPGQSVSRAAAPSSSEPVVDALTDREVEVLRALGEGLGNADIAQRLGISPHTARTHVTRVLRKLGLRSRIEAGAEARRRGLAA